MTKPREHGHRSHRGFTLVEVLTAIAVLSLILVILAQMLGFTARTTGLSSHQMSATQNARLVLDAMDRDFASLLSQNGETVCVLPLTTSNPKVSSFQIAFLSNARGPVSAGSQFRYLAVTYTYQFTNSQVIRETEPITWSLSNPMQELLAPTGTVQSSPLASYVLAFEAVLSLDDGSTVPLPSSTSTPDTWWTTTINGQALPNNYIALVLSKPPINPSNRRVRAITVAIAALDKQTFQFPNIANINPDLASPTINNQTPVESWNSALSQGNPSGVPSVAIATLHFDQRSFPLR